MRFLKLYITLFFTGFSAGIFAQEPDSPYPDLPVFGMYNLLQKLKVKEMDVWNCFDSSCNWKEMNSFILFDQLNRIDKEMDVDEGKNEPYELYTYPGKNEITKKYNAEDYWITHKYILNDSGLLAKQTIEWNKNVIEDTYTYTDSLLDKEEIVDMNGTTFQDTITFKNEYRDGKLIKRYNNKGSRIEEYKYDNAGNLVEQTVETKDMGEQKKTIRYFYSQKRMAKKLEEFYTDGRKEDSRTKETVFTYESNGLLSEESYVVKGKKFHILYTYIY